MKVLQVNKFYPPVIGGVEKVVYDLATGMRDIAETEVLVANDIWKYQNEWLDGVNVHRVPSIGTYFSMPVAPTFPIWLKKFNPDIIHFHFPFPLGELSYVLLGILKKRKSKTVVTWHSDIVRQKKFLCMYDPLLRNFLSRVDKIIATSPNMIEHSVYLQDFKEKCEVIPLGIDIQPLQQVDDGKVKELRQKIKAEKLILFVGRLVYYKGIEYLIEAMREVDASLIVVGEGVLKEQLQQRANEMGIADRIIFAGKASDEELGVYFHACDIFVLPSVERSEAFGLVQAEAMACGKPVISTNLTTGVPYVNEDGKTGIVVPPKDVSALAQAITFLLQNEEVRERYGEQARERVEEFFTKERMVRNVYRLYERLLGSEK